MTRPKRFGPIPGRVLLLVAAVASAASCGPEIRFPQAPLPPVPPGIAAPPYAAFLRGRLDTLDFSASDGDGDPVASVRANLTGLPPGNDATFSTAAVPGLSGLQCRLLWTAGTSDTGVYPVSFTASNAMTGPTETILLYTVSHEVDTFPVVTCPDTVHVVVGVPHTFSVTAADPDGDPILEVVPSVHRPGSNVNYLIHELSWTRTLSGSTAEGTLQIRVDGAGWFPVQFQAMNAGHGFATTLVVARP